MISQPQFVGLPDTIGCSFVVLLDSGFSDPAALKLLDIHLRRQVLGVEPIDHLGRCTSVSSQGYQVHLIAFRQAEHDAGMAQAIERAALAIGIGFELGNGQ